MNPRISKRLAVDPERFSEAIAKIGAFNERGNHLLREEIDRVVEELGGGVKSGHFRGISVSGLNAARQSSTSLEDRAYPILEAMRRLSGIDATKDKCLHRFENVRLQPSLRFECILKSNAPDDDGLQQYEMREFYFDLDETKDEAVDPENGNRVLNIRYGLEEATLDIVACSSKPDLTRPILGARKSRMPGAPEVPKSDGDVIARLPDKGALRWILEARIEGSVMRGALEAETLCHFFCSDSANGEVTLACHPNSLKVRVVNEADHPSTMTVQEVHRQRMKSALVTRDARRAQEEYVFFRCHLNGDW